ncbi:hypothetical protein B0H16DRAFT_1607058 [Mycena metata]|uniref:Uncharacterized protein n=1 Tax=Mycena metata TaxID=1033252 RepID=A0AAD7MJA3_9AGAR|nr:hypothetical protein B0H16DRAFT_1607058 [Mycena metata]
MQDEFWEDNNAAIKYSGNWARSYGSIYHGSTVMRTRQLGDSMSVKFKGSTIRLMGAQGWDHGNFIVNLDGKETTVDGYCCGTGGGVPQVIQFEATGLTTGPHTLNVTNSAAGPYGTVLEVDALLISSHQDTLLDNLYFPLITLFVCALVFAVLRRRRRPLRLANTTSQQTIPLSSLDFVTPLPNHDKRTLPQTFPNEGYSTPGASSSSGGMPPNYTPAPQADDSELVERIAQRVARLVQQDAPPTYETTTAAASPP